MRFSMALPSKLVRRNESNISGKSEMSSMSSPGSAAGMLLGLLMVFDHESASVRVEAVNAGSDGWHEAFGPVVSHNGEHILSAVPKRSGYAPEDRAVRFHGVAPEDVFEVKFAVRQ